MAAILLRTSYMYTYHDMKQLQWTTLELSDMYQSFFIFFIAVAYPPDMYQSFFIFFIAVAYPPVCIDVCVALTHSCHAEDGVSVMVTGKCVMRGDEHSRSSRCPGLFFLRWHTPCNPEYRLHTH